jgi:hypothetical protein
MHGGVVHLCTKVHWRLVGRLAFDFGIENCIWRASDLVASTAVHLPEVGLAAVNTVRWVHDAVSYSPAAWAFNQHGAYGMHLHEHIATELVGIQLGKDFVCKHITFHNVCEDTNHWIATSLYALAPCQTGRLSRHLITLFLKSPRSKLWHYMLFVLL